MKLFLIQRLEYDYDECDAHIVRAVSAKRAREACPVGYEDKDEWINPKKSTCEWIKLNRSYNEEVLLSSFNAG